MFYRGMPYLYSFRCNGEAFDVFWHDGEFYLHDRLWYNKKRDSSEEFKYFETSEECLNEMLKIGAFKDWKLIDHADQRRKDIEEFGKSMGKTQNEINEELVKQGFSV